MAKIRSIFNKLYSEHLLLTNTITCGGLLTVGDAIVQYVDRRRVSKTVVSVESVQQCHQPGQGDTQTRNGPGLTKQKDVFKAKDLHNASTSHDWNRSARMCFIGLALGPCNHYFYMLLDRYLVGRGWKIIVKKLAADQFIAAPLFNTVFIFGSCYLERKTTSTACQEWITKFPVIYLGDWVYWPPIQFVNFYFFPPKFRVLYVAVATLVWNSYLSFVKHNVTGLGDLYNGSNVEGSLVSTKPSSDTSPPQSNNLLENVT